MSTPPEPALVDVVKEPIYDVMLASVLYHTYAFIYQSPARFILWYFFPTEEEHTYTLFHQCALIVIIVI